MAQRTATVAIYQSDPKALFAEEVAACRPDTSNTAILRGVSPLPIDRFKILPIELLCAIDSKPLTSLQFFFITLPELRLFTLHFPSFQLVDCDFI